MTIAPPSDPLIVTPSDANPLPDWPRLLWDALEEEALLVVDAGDRVVAWNEGARKLFGYTAAEIVGEPVARLLKPSDAESGAEDSFARARTEGRWRGQGWRARADGKFFYASLVYSSLAGTPATAGAIGVLVRNITREHQESARMSRSEAAFTTAEAVARVGHWVLELGNLEEIDENPLRWSAETYRLFGFEPGGVEVTNDLFFSCVHPEDREAVQAAVGHAIEQRSTYNVEHRISRPDGSEGRLLERGTVVCDPDGRPLRILGTVQDVSDHAAIAKSLEEKRATLQEVLDSVPRCIFWKDRDFIWQGCNRYFTAQYHLDSPNDVIGRVDLDFEMWHSEAEGLRGIDGEVMATGISALARVVPLHSRAGSPHWVEYSAVPLRDRTEAIVGVLGTYYDVTERVEGTAALEALNLTLEQRVFDRTAELTTVNGDLEVFAYTVSHDLRAPLRHIDGFVRLLGQELGPDLPAEAQRHLDIIGRSAHRMGVLIDELLDFSRRGRAPLHLESVPLELLVRSVIEMLTPGTEDRTIVWEIGELPVVHADPALLRLVWQNLIENALKFTHTRDEVVITIGTLPGEPGFDVLFVRDNGVGFDMRYVGRLFGVFQRLHTDSEFEGTGIGLANVQRIIQRHGGQVWAVGEVGVGATFSFSLPHEELQP